MNFYRQALELDNENVDALVARGALYNRSVFFTLIPTRFVNSKRLGKRYFLHKCRKTQQSRKQYPLACKDLEEAYKLDPKHKNAKNYLIQILFDQGNGCSFTIVLTKKSTFSNTFRNYFGNSVKKLII